VTAPLSLDERFEVGGCRECADALDGYTGHPHCAVCHRSWTDLGEAHCAWCHSHFPTVDGFNDHIVEVSGRDGRHR